MPINNFGDFPGGSDSKESACNIGDPRFDPWIGKIPWRKEWQPTPVFLPGELLGQRRLAGLQSIWSQRVEHDWATKIVNYLHSIYVLLGIIRNLEMT